VSNYSISINDFNVPAHPLPEKWVFYGRFRLEFSSAPDCGGRVEPDRFCEFQEFEEAHS
jgi:hypothetical protein